MSCIFTDQEILGFLDAIAEQNIYKKIDGKTQRNIDVFKDLARRMGDEKTAEQWRGKWKSLKAKYLEEKRKSSKSGNYYYISYIST